MDIKLGEFKYIGKCDCNRKELINGELKRVCDGRLYEYTPMTINGQTHPPGAVPQRWCRSKHYKPEQHKDAVFM